MNASTITHPGPLQAPASGPAPPRATPTSADAPGGDDRRGWQRPALAVLLIVTLLLRLWGIRQGLPYSYNVDEATHFVPRAIAFFSGDYNPRYFYNPPAYSYLLHIVFELWFGSSDAATRTFVSDPTEVYVVARVLAAILGTGAVWLTYLAGARFHSRNLGLLAAAIFGLAFLPIFYSHLALNDVPALAPVALALYGTAGVIRGGRLRDYALAGLGIGLAAATKYTGGITLLCLIAAFACHGARGELWIAARRFGVGLLVALSAFVICNPYSVLDFPAFQAGLSQQASLAAGQDPVKLGTTPGSGIGYYLWTFTWGLGWGPALAALGGAALLLARRRLTLALVLLPAPIAFILFMGDQQRFFGRWLMPIFPIVAIVSAYGAIELVGWLVRVLRLAQPLAGGLLAVLMLAQSVVAVLHDDAVLARPDTRNLTRAWMVDHVPAGAKVVIEPVVSDTWAADIGTSLPWTLNGARWYRYATWLSEVDNQGKPLSAGKRRFVVVDQYERTLQPALLGQYASRGFCWLVVGSLQAGRAFAQPKEAPGAIAYYAALASRAHLAYHISPFAPGAHSVPFNFDWSIDYYPRQYRLPGPEMSVYRLAGGKCS